MPQERKFPLIVWEHTEDYKKEAKEAEKRLENITGRLYKRGFTCGALCTVKIDENGFYEAWLNSSKDIYRSKWSLDEATAHAIERGSTNWWTLDELEQFVEGKGPVFEEAMWDLGFRRHKISPEKWARITKEEKGKGSPLHNKLWQQKHGKIYAVIPQDEMLRLQGLLSPVNGQDERFFYDMKAGKRNMILVRPSPETNGETLNIQGEVFAYGAHISAHQEGFDILATNIKLNGSDGIHIQAVKMDKSYFTECVWPSQIPVPKLYDLADDLIAKVNSGQDARK